MIIQQEFSIKLDFDYSDSQKELLHSLVEEGLVAEIGNVVEIPNQNFEAASKLPNEYTIMCPSCTMSCKHPQAVITNKLWATNKKDDTCTVPCG